MRNILAFIAAFTLSASASASVMACNTTADRGTNNVFDWNGIINGKSETAEDFFNQLLNKPNSFGDDLYSSINDYTNLSILKNDSKYNTEYAAAQEAVNNQINTTIASLKAKGRGWEKEWNNFLKASYNGDVNVYRDHLLSQQAAIIMKADYISHNYSDFQYYNQYDMNPWKKDLWESVNPNGTGSQKYTTVSDYVTGKGGTVDKGAFATNIWIIANSVGDKTNDFSVLNTIVQNSASWTDIHTNVVPVIKTKDNIQNGTAEQDDYNSINGLLSDNQAKLAKVMLKNNESIWTRQIVIKFDTDKTFDDGITPQSFTNSLPALTRIIDDIKNNGFNTAFESYNAPATASSASGDLGLVNINATGTASFQYYLYRYVTSALGAGKGIDAVQPYQLPQADTTLTGGQLDLTKFLATINHSVSSNPNNSSPYNDVAYIPDKDMPNSGNLLPAVANNGPGVGVFINEDGIHFVQTPGITYNPTPVSKSMTSIINDFNVVKSTGKKNIKWNSVQDLVNRPNGLASNPYLSYLQTEYLLQTQRDEKPPFDLNTALSDFTKTGKVSDPTTSWWDYILYFNNSTDLIHWNTHSISSMLGENINASDQTVYNFAKSMMNWFDTTKENRWNKLQGLQVNNTYIQAVEDLNTTWDSKPNAAVARMDANDIANYLVKVGDQTLWWYDPNSITS